MKFHTISPKIAATLIIITMFTTMIAEAQTQAPPPPPPVQAETQDSSNASLEAAVDPVKEREVIDNIVNGKQAVTALDLATAQMYFEQAFTKCDEYHVKGALMARTYMALGSFFAGFLQQVPQGTEFIKMALAENAAVQPEPELTNEIVINTFNMVKKQLGLTGAAQTGQVNQGGAAAISPGGFWVMKHKRITQAKRMHPLGIYIEVNPMVAITGVKLYFRLPSDRNYQAAPMQKNGNMFGMFIDCDVIALLDPQALYYYIEVIGGDGSIIANEGTLANPIEIKLIKKEDFQGTQPVLPGMDDASECNPDEAAPCPPWNPHCHDTPCVTSEDCIGKKICSMEGYCIKDSKSSDDEELPAHGFSLWGGLGLGFGFVGGQAEDGLCGNATCLEEDGNGIDLAPGLSPSFMFTRLGVGYIFMDFLRVGAWIRLQHMYNDKMKIAGMGAELPEEQQALIKKVRGPMWGISASLFYWGNGEWMGGGYVLDDDGNLAEDQGLRLYARVEFNFFGAMYHRLSLTGEGPDGADIKVYRQRASGMQGIGIGPGILYGVSKHVDVGAELMYDYVGVGTDHWSHNFDIALLMHFHL